MREYEDDFYIKTVSGRKQHLNLITNGWCSSSLKIVYIILYEKPICTEDDSIAMIRLYWKEEAINLQEQVMAFYLNTANKLIGFKLISTGTTTVCLVDIKLTVSLALHCTATFLIIAHNHPSGNTKPSKQDIQFTDKVKQALRLIDVTLLDHIIITQHSYLSLKSEGNC